ncbi:MAG: Glycosyl transferase [archaeon GW2011_AR13]|nr:MAG: Glycosyl transferase [archaeon GW2011_AR13]
MMKKIKNTKSISFVIPALNEEKAIKRVIKEIPVDELKNKGYEIEIMIVDNGSIDKTGYIAKKNGATVFIQPVRGYGNAYKAGFANAHGEIIITGDADCTYPFKDSPKFLEILEKENLDFINTNRLHNVHKDNMHWTHQFGNWFLATLCKTLWWQFPFKDSQSGMWIFKKNAWKKLNVKSSGMPFSQELKIEACTKGCKCKEIEITYGARVGEVKLRGLRDAFGNTFHLFKKRIKG